MRVFDDDTRRRLDGLRVAAARLLARGAAPGVPGKGSGGRLEFLDHRPYGPGDDPRQIDWNLMGRLDELHVKRFRGESGLDVRVLVDRSASMGVCGGTKDVTSRRVAAGVACALAGEGRVIRVDALGESLDDIGVVRRPEDIPALFDRLEALTECRGRVDGPSIPSLFGDVRARRLVVILSDCLDEGILETALAVERSARVEVVVGVVIAAEERHPTLRGAVRLLGVEGEGSTRVSVSPEVRDRYARLFDEHLQELGRVAARRGAATVELACERPFERTTLQLLGLEAAT